MKIIAHRVYGQPKIAKPKFCNNQNFLGSVEFAKGCKCKVWAHDGMFYLLHRDWFSNFIPVDVAAKVLGRKHNHKFIYNDNFGSVGLRNEALLEITQDDWQDKDCYCAAVNLCATTARMLGFPDTELMYYNWENMYEQFLELIGEPLIQNQFSMLRTM